MNTCRISSASQVKIWTVWQQFSATLYQTPRVRQDCNFSPLHLLKYLLIFTLLIFLSPNNVLNMYFLWNTHVYIYNPNYTNSFYQILTYKCYNTDLKLASKIFLLSEHYVWEISIKNVQNTFCWMKQISYVKVYLTKKSRPCIIIIWYKQKVSNENVAGKKETGLPVSIATIKHYVHFTTIFP